MKTKLLTLFSLISLAFAAQTYSISPAKTVTFSAPYNNITINDIYMTNTGSTTLSITWELISINLPATWDYSMCDLGTCYTGIPAGPNTMNTATAGGANPFLGLNINPQAVAGTGTVVVRAYKTGSPSSADTLTWKITAGAVGVEELTASKTGIKIYPNPVANSLNIEFGSTKVQEVTITDALGRTILKPITSTGNNTIDLSALQKGFYLVNIVTDEKVMFKRIVKE
ncbi:MAG: T9SS type A sorting domain-containing protein [Bacteroidetes bacterium]|nr:T9SS type A sorting domain-containing protein [Bacteroidota bacterium]